MVIEAVVTAEYVARKGGVCTEAQLSCLQASLCLASSFKQESKLQSHAATPVLSISPSIATKPKLGILALAVGACRGDTEHAALCQHGSQGEVQPPVYPGPPRQAGAEPAGHHQQAEE